MGSRELRKRKLDETNIPLGMAERVMPNGKRRLHLLKAEKKAINHSLLVERAVALFLDVEHDHPWTEIAKELGMSMVSLKDLTKSDEFMAKYAEFYAELGHDPRLRASQAALVDMLPAAIRGLKELVNCNSPSVKLSAIKEVIRLNGIDQPKTSGSDRTELAEFLKDAGVNLTQVNVNVPAEYQQAVRDTIDAKFSDTSARGDVPVDNVETALVVPLEP